MIEDHVSGYDKEVAFKTFVFIQEMMRFPYFHKYFLHNFLNIHRGGEIEPCEIINLFPVMIV